MKVVMKSEYKNGEGFVVGITKAPKEASTKADVIVLGTMKNKRSTAQYYTPDEAMAVGNGLLRAVEVVMTKKFEEFRTEKDKK